jgi:hypothetical protein
LSEVSTDQLKRAVESPRGRICPVGADPRNARRTIGLARQRSCLRLRWAPNASRAYAWSRDMDSGPTRRFFAVLGISPINGPRDAVRAAIVAEARSRK